MAEQSNDQGPKVLAVEVVQWMTRTGVGDLKNHEGLWKGETDEWQIKFNPHGEVVGGVNPFTFEMAHKEYLQFAVVAPNGGALMGITEDDLIRHFQQADQPGEAA